MLYEKNYSDAVEYPSWLCKLSQSEYHNDQPSVRWPQHITVSRHNIFHTIRETVKKIQGSKFLLWSIFLKNISRLYSLGGLGVVWSVLWVCTIYDTPALHPSLHPSEADLFTREGANVGRGSQRVVRLTVIVRGGSRNFKTGAGGGGGHPAHRSWIRLW